MIDMERNRVRGYCKSKSGKNISYVTWKPSRTAVETEEVERLENIARSVGLKVGLLGIEEGMSKKEMLELSTHFDPISDWINRRAYRKTFENSHRDQEEAFY